MLDVTRNPAAARRGFTLIELLVVIAIIAVLVGLTAAGVMKFAGVGPNNATVSTVKMVGNLLTRQWQTVADKADKGEGKQFDAVRAGIEANLSGGDGLASLRARVIYVKLRLRQAFPASFAEVLGAQPAYSLPALKEYADYLTLELGYSANAASWPPADVQNAICLLMILEKGPGTAANQDELGKVTATLHNAPSKNARGLVDGYGSPVVFCRWPTGFANPNPNGLSKPVGNTLDAVGADAQDPKGYLSANTWAGTSASQSYCTAIGQLKLVNNAWQPAPPPAGQAWRLAPVVASAGADKVLGLNLVDFSTSGGGTQDNRYSTSYSGN